MYAIVLLTALTATSGWGVSRSCPNGGCATTYVAPNTVVAAAPSAPVPTYVPTTSTLPAQASTPVTYSYSPAPARRPVVYTYGLTANCPGGACPRR
jgi:hypothetical protein